jgi:PTH1 family peptidyl-tRNA hydrolase
MYVIAGLGNPGAEYALTRHNAGFLTIDVLCAMLNIKLTRHTHKALVGSGSLGTEKIVLAKPLTFMNLSGESVAKLVKWYKLDMDKLIIIYDDIDLPVGEIRIRPSGSAGTHNGMRSIIYSLGRDDFTRIRVGVGGPHGEKPLAAHVLSKPDEQEQRPLTEAIKNAAMAAKLIVERGVGEAQASYNRKAKSRLDNSPTEGSPGDER